jgi:GDP-L-fucose synthase
MSDGQNRAYNLEGKRVWVAGHNGMVGRALVRRLMPAQAHVLTVDRVELDLRRQSDIEGWMAANRPDAVIVAAATVGGIEANRTRPVDFLYDNLAIATNVIRAAAEAGVEKLMFLGSSCIFPRDTDQPIREESVLTGPLEPTNEWYAIAKIAGIKLCQAYRRQFGKDFIAVTPTNLYGPGSHLDPSTSHVISALIRKIHEAHMDGAGAVEVWGTGRPEREFLYVDDAADALVFLMQHYSDEGLINVAGGETVTIANLALLVAEIVGYRGNLRFDTSKPDGMPRKALDSTRLQKMGWRPAMPLRNGLSRTYAWFQSQACPV